MMVTLWCVEGVGEQGRPYPLTDSDRVDQAYRENGFNIYVSNRIALNRSLPDIRHPKWAALFFLFSLNPTSVTIPAVSSSMLWLQQQANNVFAVYTVYKFLKNIDITLIFRPGEVAVRRLMCVSLTCQIRFRFHVKIFVRSSGQTSLTRQLVKGWEKRTGSIFYDQGPRSSCLSTLSPPRSLQMAKIIHKMSYSWCFWSFRLAYLSLTALVNVRMIVTDVFDRDAPNVR